MARPKSMSDFASLLDTSYSPITGVSERQRPRKKSSISLAAGLMMRSEMQSPKSLAASPQHADGTDEAKYSNGLFYAYAQKSDYSQSLPYILAFASASIATQWWELVQKEYPQSERVGPQLFILRGNDMPSQIQDNVQFHHLRNRWFFMTDGTEGSTAVIPLQDYQGNPITAPAPTSAPISTPTKPPEEKSEPNFDFTKLSETLNSMTTLISENSAQIRALSVAQSEGLRRMQEINESNSTQIKALSGNQIKIQSMMEHNATHYLVLSNSSFSNQVSNQEQVRSVLQTNAEQISTLAKGQNQMATTCMSLMETIENLGTTVARVGESVAQRAGGNGKSDVGEMTAAPSGAVGNFISPGPRKLNRRIKSVWYEYESNASPTAAARRDVGLLETPSKTSRGKRM